MVRDVLEEFGRPEYTGENRCVPCTVVNLVIAAAVAVVLGRRNRALGLFAFGASVVVIALRGYLVPGTPTLTKRYLPPRLLRWFGKEPEPAISSGFGGLDDASASTEPESVGSAGSDAGDSNAADPEAEGGEGAEGPADGHDTDEHGPTTDGGPGDDGDAAGDADAPVDVPDLETYFLERDVLEPCEEIDDLCLVAEFEDRWLAEMGDIVAAADAVDGERDESGAGDSVSDGAVDDAVDAADVIDAVGFDVDPGAFDLETRDEARFLVSNRGIAGRWPSHAAVVADVAASRTLADWVDDWDALDPETTGQVLNALRMFLERCPTGGAVEMGEEVVESCCTSHDVMAVTCEETGERLFEQRLDRVEA